jgi:hypothetical protein
MIIPRKTERLIEHGKTYKQSPVDRDHCGLGHIVIPPDIDREVYIRQVYDTGRCILISLNDDPITNVILPFHIVQQIKFPIKENERGSFVFWNNLPRINQIVVVAIIPEEDELSPFSENSIGDIESYKQYTISDVRSLKDNTRLLSVSDEESGTGNIQLQASGNEKISRVQIKADGTINMDSDNTIDIYTEEGLNVSVGSEEGEISTINITREGVLNYTDKYNNQVKIIDGQVFIETGQVKLGENAQEKAVLGDTLKAKLESLHDLIVAHTHPTAMGPSGTPLNSASFTSLKSELSQILSELVILE